MIQAESLQAGNCRYYESVAENSQLNTLVQVSVDGIEWLDEGTVFPTLEKPGNYFIKVSHFGGWLRLKNLITGKDPSFKVTIHLVLKE